MKASELKSVMKDAIDNPMTFPPLFIWGGPGIGKSSVMRQATEEKKVGFIDIRALLLDPTDAKGTPVPTIIVDGKKVPLNVFNLETFSKLGEWIGTTEWFSSGLLPTDPKWKGVIFFDELLLAPPIVTNSIMQLVLDRELGSYRLPDGAYLAAASNRETEAIGVYRLSPPLANRFVHADFDVDNEEWGKWAIVNNIAPEIIAFLLKFKPGLLYQFDPNKKAFPTPRSYEFTSRILTNTITNEELKYELIKGCIGEGTAIELKSYMSMWKDLPDLDKILAGEDIIPESLDVIYACVTGLVSKVKKQEQYDRILKYALLLQREFSVYLIKLLWAKDETKVVNSKSWKSVAETLAAERILI